MAKAGILSMCLFALVTLAAAVLAMQSAGDARRYLSVRHM